MSNLEISSLDAYYGKAAAISGISITAGKGEIVSIIGPNGAGKSTLLGAVMGLIPCQATSIRFDGQSIDKLTVEERLELGLCLVPEKRELFPSLTVRQNLRLGAYRRRSSTREIENSIDEVLALFPRLQERLTQRAENLSGGERQMLALGRALMSSPRMLMLDEPSLGLAPLIITQIFDIIAKLRSTGVGILLVEQNARAALQISQKGYVLEGGRIALEGTPDALSRNDELVRSYLGFSSSGETTKASVTMHSA